MTITTKRGFIAALLLVSIGSIVILTAHRSAEPAVPIYPHARTIEQDDYHATDSGGSRQKRIRFVTNDPIPVVKAWYERHLQKNWFKNYYGYVPLSDMVYGNRHSKDGFSEYTLGLTLTRIHNETHVTIIIIQ